MHHASLIFMAAAQFVGTLGNTPDEVARPTFAPLPYRIISFHEGQVDLRLVNLAREIGFNGVQIQTENGTLEPLKKFAEYDRQTHAVAACHSLGMNVSIWIHELNDIPPDLFVAYRGQPLKVGDAICNYGISGDQKVVVNLDSKKLWQLLSDRYDYILTKLIPKVDGLVLTVTETQIHATNPKLFVRLVHLLDEKCRMRGKTLHLRTFVWHRNDLSSLLQTLNQVRPNIPVMSKCVPQDWHLASINAPELGQVGNHPQLEEWDVEGEYFGLNKLVNCMPELLQDQLAYGMAHGVQGVCVRVNRGDQSVLRQPSEVNLWTLGLLASEKGATLEDVWNRWATYRYGKAAAPVVISALIDSTRVVRECLYLDHFSFYDPRYPLGPAGEPDPFQHNSNPQYWSEDFRSLHDRIVLGDEDEIEKVDADKKAAIQCAFKALMSLAKARPFLSASDYLQLYRGLRTNYIQLSWRSPMQLAYLRHRLLLRTADVEIRLRLIASIRTDLEEMRKVTSNAEPLIPSDSDQARKWADEMEKLLPQT